MSHPAGFSRRRRWNWILLGVTCAFLYMGRFNLVALKDTGALTREELGFIDAAGGIAYGLSFIINGPLADRLRPHAHHVYSHRHVGRAAA